MEKNKWKSVGKGSWVFDYILKPSKALNLPVLLISDSVRSTQRGGKLADAFPTA